MGLLHVMEVIVPVGGPSTFVLRVDEIVARLRTSAVEPVYQSAIADRPSPPLTARSLCDKVNWLQKQVSLTTKTADVALADHVNVLTRRL